MPDWTMLETQVLTSEVPWLCGWPDYLSAKGATT
jgi:hypothetical protein